METQNEERIEKIYQMQRRMFPHEEYYRRFMMVCPSKPTRADETPKILERFNHEAQALKEARAATKIIGNAVSDLKQRGYQGKNLLELIRHGKGIRKFSKELDPYPRKFYEGIDLYAVRYWEIGALELYDQALKEIGVAPVTRIAKSGGLKRVWPQQLTKGTYRENVQENIKSLYNN